jgi:hypothetical protein
LTSVFMRGMSDSMPTPPQSLTKPNLDTTVSGSRYTGGRWTR